jgi:hypothetical protein
MSTSSQSLLPFGSADTDDASELAPEVRRAGLRLYRQAWDAYRAAGCPYGRTDEAMLVWYSFQPGNTDPTPATSKN